MSDVVRQCVQKSYKISGPPNSPEDLNTHIALRSSVMLRLVVVLCCWIPVVAKAGPGERRVRKAAQGVHTFRSVPPDVPLFITDLAAVSPNKCDSQMCGINWGGMSPFNESVSAFPVSFLVCSLSCFCLQCRGENEGLHFDSDLI